MAQDLLDRFFRDAEGKTNRQIDVYFTLEDMGIQRERAEEGLEFLSSRGLINMFGPDVAFLTELGIAAIAEEKNISKLQKQARDFAQVKPPVPSQSQSQSQSQPQLQSQSQSQSQPQPQPQAQREAPKQEASAVDPPPGPLPPHSDRAQLRFIDPDGGEHLVQLGWNCTIGRVEGNTIHLPDQRASKKHAEVKFENNKWILADLGAANGTMVNGSYVDAHGLRHGDQILIGRTTLVFEAPRVITPPPRDAEQAPAKAAERAPARETRETREARDTRDTRDLRETERPAPSESRPDRSAEIRVVKGRPESARPQPQVQARGRPQPGPRQEEDLFETPQRAPEPAKPRVPPFPGPARPAQPAQPIDDPDDLFAAPSTRENRPTDDLFESDTGKRPAASGDLFADDRQRDEPSAHDLFSEAAIPRPAVEAPSNLFDEEPNTVFSRSEERRALDALPIEAPDTMEPLAPIDPLADPLSPMMEEPILEHAPPSRPRDVGLEATMVNASLRDLAHESGLEIVEEPWNEADAHTPISARLVEPQTEQHEREDLLANKPVAHDEIEEPVRPREVAMRARSKSGAVDREATRLAPGEMVLGGDEDQDTEGATPKSARPGLRDVEIGEVSGELPLWGDEKRPAGSHPAFAQGSAQHIATLEREEPGEELPEAEPELSDLSLSGLPGPGESPFHRTLKALRSHVERADLPDRDRVLAAIDLLERHPYVRVALNLSERDS